MKTTTINTERELKHFVAENRSKITAIKAIVRDELAKVEIKKEEASC